MLFGAAGTAVAAACVGLSLGIARADNPSPLYVDVTSKGGQCSDGLKVSEVSIVKPLCTLAKAVQVAPDGATVLVRAGNYPKLTVDRAFGDRVTVKVYPGEKAELRGHTSPPRPDASAWSSSVSPT